MQFRWNGVSERDMDLLFLEEFALNADFLNLFIQKIGNTELFSYKIVSGEVSLTDAALGESDLTIVLEKGGRKVALLIEDKIHAIAQPRQYERYVERGEKGVREEQYSAFYVFLIAPAEYMKNNSSAAKYPLKVTYEECRELFIAPTTVRNQLKYQQLSAAIEQARRPYTKIVDAVSTTFWSKYVCYLHTHYPDIELKSKVKEKSKNGDWPTYKTSLDLKPVYIHHKMKMRGVEYSYIDLTFNGLAAHREELKALLKDMLGEQYVPQFGIHKAGNSAVLRLVALKYLDWQIPFEEQIDVVEDHLRLVSLLCETAKQIGRDRLIDFYAAAAQKNSNEQHLRGQTMQLREYIPSDCAQLAELFYQTVHSVNAKDYTKEQLDAWATGEVDLQAWDTSFRAHRTIVATENGEIVGFGDMDESGYLDRLYVHKDYQGQGVASAICDELERFAAGKTLTTHASITAKPFFLHRGYHVVRKQEVVRHGVVLTNFVMEKQPERTK